MDGCCVSFYKYDFRKCLLICKIDLSKIDNLDKIDDLDNLHNIFIETKYIEIETEYIGFSYNELMEILERFTYIRKLLISGRPFDLSLYSLPKSLKCLDLGGLVNMDTGRKIILDDLKYENNLHLLSINIIYYFEIDGLYLENQNTEYKISEIHNTNIPYIKTLRKIKLDCFDAYNSSFEEKIIPKILDSELLRFYKNNISSIKYNNRKGVIIINISKYRK